MSIREVVNNLYFTFVGGRVSRCRVLFLRGFIRRCGVLLLELFFRSVCKG